MASPYETANQNQGGPLNGAADLLRQAMMSGTQRYVDFSLSLFTYTHLPFFHVLFLLHEAIPAAISHATHYTLHTTLHPHDFCRASFSLLRPAHRHARALRHSSESAATRPAATLG